MLLTDMIIRTKKLLAREEEDSPKFADLLERLDALEAMRCEKPKTKKKTAKKKK